MQLFKGRIALSSVCLCKCDKISSLPISCVNYTCISQVSYIHIKLSDIYVKRYIYTSSFIYIYIYIYIYSYQVPRYSCQNIFPLPMHLCLYRDDFLVRSPMDGELLGLEWGIIRQVSNTIFPDQNFCVRCQHSKGSDTM